MTIIGDSDMPIEVLLAEDSPGDVRLTQEAFRDANKTIHLQVASDGVEAMSIPKREGVYAGFVRPDIILLDLNLPRMDGREVLARIKSRCQPEVDSGGHPHDIRFRSGHCKNVSTAGELLPQQTRATRRI
jgi:CheY-like chemotaxis protein